MTDKYDIEAVLVDFGGVLTSSVRDAFAAASRELVGDPDCLEHLFATDEVCARLLVEQESGRMTEAEFDNGMAARLRRLGIEVGGMGNFVARIQQALKPDRAMLEAIRGLHGRGVPVAVVSNAFGDDCYRGYDLTQLARTVVASNEVGVRKPSRRIYRIACERLGVEPERTVLVDDLAMNIVGASRIGIRGIHHERTEDTLHALAQLFPVDHTAGGVLR